MDGLAELHIVMLELFQSAMFNPLTPRGWPFRSKIILSSVTHSKVRFMVA